MIRRAALLVADDTLATSLSRYLMVVQGFRSTQQIVPPPTLLQGGSPFALFQYLSDALEGGDRQDGDLRDILVLVDLVRDCGVTWSEANPLGVDHPFVRAIAMLVLAFPELQFAFLVQQSADGWLGGVRGRILGELRTLETAHLIRSTCDLRRIVSFAQGGYTTLFDPAGLRNSIRMLSHVVPEDGADLSYLSVRSGLAAAIDEEADYAFFNSYVAFRWGWRAHPVTSEAVFGQLFGKSRAANAHDRLTFLLEDIYLNFADRVPGLHTSELQKRDEDYDGLLEACRRFFVTVGRGQLRDRGVWRRNLAYIRALRRTGRVVRVVYKPLAGVFETAAALQMEEARPAEGTRHAGQQEEKGNWQGHSAPGRLLVIAAGLLERAKLILKSASNPREAVVAATLALEARELLGWKTPTTGLEALCVQHEAEVSAESMFVGIEYNFDVRKRFREISLEVKEIARSFHGRRRRRSAISAQLTIIERLAQRFRVLHQIEEELACLAEARKLRFDLWVHEKWWRWPAWPILRYLALTLKSLPVFLTVVFVWAVFFGLSYYLFGQLADKPDLAFWDAMVSAWRAFFTGNSTSEWAYLGNTKTTGGWESFWSAWLTFQGIISSTNLGLLLSHLYLIVSRR